MNAERIKAILDFARDFFPDGEIDEIQALALAGVKATEWYRGNLDDHECFIELHKIFAAQGDKA